MVCVSQKAESEWEGMRGKVEEAGGPPTRSPGMGQTAFDSQWEVPGGQSAGGATPLIYFFKVVPLAV